MAYFLLGAAVVLALATPLFLWHGRRAAQRARQAEAQAHTSERLAFVGTLAGGLAHEIRNPLSAFSLNLQLLAEDLANGDAVAGKRARKRLETLRSETARLNDILEDFLRFARGQKLEPKLCDLNQVVQGVLDFQSAEATTRGVHIRSAFGEAPPVRLDVDLFRQALLNLTINAEQAMPQGGDLMVRTYPGRNAACIDIVDTGNGIPDDVLPHIFDAYFSTKSKGTGLGLPTARRIIEEHGGSVAVHTRLNEGTCVTVTVPAAQEKR